MRDKKRFAILEFLKTTAVGGLLFLLPLIVLGALIGQVTPIVLTIASTLRKMLPSFFQTPLGIAILILLAIGVLLLICFAAGIVARHSLSRKLSKAFEKKLTLLFPRYSILKDQMADSIGDQQNRPQMKAVAVTWQGQVRLAFETERHPGAGTVTVYLPGSPDPWAGHVATYEASCVASLDATFGDVLSTCEQLGRGTAQVLAGHSDARADSRE